MKENKYLYFGYLLLIGVVVYAMNILTPLYADDWHFKFIFGTSDPVNSIGDLFYSLYLHYFNYTWRFVPHFFVQLFDGILGKAAFNIVNSLVFVLFFYLLSTTVTTNKNSRYAYLSISLFSFFIFIDGFGDEFLWMSGACNYLWPATILLLFHRVFLMKISSPYYYPLLFIFGLLSGWTNESLVLGMAMGYLVFLWDRKFKIHRSQLFMLIGFFIGAGLMVFSPSAYERFDMYDEVLSSSGYVLAYSYALLRMFNLKVFPILLVLCTILYFAKKAETKKILKENKYLIICLLVSFLFVLFTKDDSDRSRFCIELFSLLLIFQLSVIIKIPQSLLHIMNVCVLAIIFYALLYISRNYSDYKNEVAQIEQGKELILTNEVKAPPFFRKFIVYFMHPEHDAEYDSYNKKSVYNIMAANYYGASRPLSFIPERLYKEIKSNPDQYNDFSSYPDLPFLIKKYNGKRARKVTLVLNGADVEDYPFYMRPLVKLDPKYLASRMSIRQFAVIKVDNDPYLIVGKAKWYEGRIEEIIVE